MWEEMEAANAMMNADAATVNENEPWTSPNAAELDKKGRVRADDFERAAHGFSGLQTQATAACRGEIRQ